MSDYSKAKREYDAIVARERAEAAMTDHDPMLDGITRWNVHMGDAGYPDYSVFSGFREKPDGKYVLFSDIPALISRVREEERVERLRRLHQEPCAHYEQGQRDERANHVNDDCVWGQGECIPNCPSCKRMDELINERFAGEKWAFDRAREAGIAMFDGAHKLMSDGHYSYFVPSKEDFLESLDAIGTSYAPTPPSGGCPNCGTLIPAHYCMGPPAVDRYCQCVCHESLSRMDPHPNEKCRCNGGTGYDAL